MGLQANLLLQAQRQVCLKLLTQSMIVVGQEVIKFIIIIIYSYIII